MSTPHPNAVLFARGTLARLALWPTLRLAVHTSWGGPASAEKQRWLAGVLVDQFEPFLVGHFSPVHPSASTSTSASARSRMTSFGSTSASGMGTGTEREREPPPDDVYVEELLLQIMTDEFDVVLEDDSAAAVAKDIIKLFESVRAGDETFVRELETQADMVKGKVPKHEIDVGSGSESENGSGSEWEDDDDDDDNREPIPQLLDHAASREEPQVDEDGFTMVKKKGRR